MEVTLLKVLLSRISSFFALSSCDNIRSEPVLKYYQNTEEILMLLKPIVDAVLNSETPSEEAADKLFEELCYSVSELKELFQKWQSLSSKLYFVFLSDTLISRIQKISLDLFQFLQASHEDIFIESNSSLEQCVQKIRYVRHEQSSTVFKDALRDQVEGVAPSSEVLAKIAGCLNLRSNQEVLIEAVALEKLKENAEQSEKTGEAEYIEQMIALVTCMHERLLTMKQSENYSPVSIPPDFCCPLSLDLMTDPVIVSSGQTYERAFIKEWIDLGLTVCPKTRQTLAHTNLIPNYTVKALIANWCESNNVKLPDPLKFVSANQPSPLLGSRNSVVHRDSPAFPYNRNYPPMSPESTRSEGSPANILSSPSRNLPQPDNSLPSVPVNVLGLDTERVSLTASEDSVVTLEDDNLVIQSSITPLRTDYHGASGAELPQSHSRTSSSSNAVSDFPREVSEDAEASLVSTMTGCAADASSEVKVEPPPKSDALTNTLLRESDQFPPKLMETRSRSHNLWRRPSERFIPRILSSSSSIETRPDLSGVEAQVEKLAEDLKNPSLETIRAAAAEIRLLAKHNMDNRIVIAKCGVITLLVDLLMSTDPEIQEHAVTALLNLSINDNNKTIIAQAKAIEPLIQVLQTGSPEAKENSAATLFSLSVIEENKIKIGRSGAIVPLVDLLGNGTPRGKKDAATALFNLSIFHENKGRIVQAGAVKHLLELMDPAAGMVDKAVAVLANLATIPEGRTAIGQEGGIPVLVEVVELGSARGKENAAAALLQLCTSSNRFCSQVLQEGAVPPLVALSQSGTPRAREKAQTLLRYFRNHRHGGGAGRG